MNNDEATAFDRKMAEIDERRMTDREESIAETNFQGGRKIGYQQGCDDGRLGWPSMLTIGSLVFLAAIGGFAIGVWAGAA